MITTAEAGLPHEDWRNEQYDLFSKTKDAHESGGGFIFGQVPTGGGKTAVASALGHLCGPVLYVAGTLGLLDQAEREYGFVVIKGRQEYDCVHEKKVDHWQAKGRTPPHASDCHYPSMTKCPFADKCPYLLAKHAALASPKMGCTYKYAMLSRLVRERPGIVVLDEVHEAVNEVLSFGEYRIDEWRRRDWNLPTFPYRRPYGGRGDVMNPAATGRTIDWVLRAQRELTGYDPETEEGAKAKRMLDRLTRLEEEIPVTDWFLECGNGVAIRYRQGRRYRLPALILRPLDPSPVAGRLWRKKKTTLLMSATIGSSPEAIAMELGIDDYTFLSYDHPLPSSCRPIYNLDVPRLTKRNLDDKPGLLTVQAVAIRRFIESLPPHWRGVVLTSSWKKVGTLRKLLGMWLPGRVFDPPDGGTSARITAFLEDPRDGLIAVDTVQGWGHGLDLRGNLGRFAVVAGVPFDNPSDPFTRARRKRPSGEKYYWWKAYTSIVQAAGRVSRGEQMSDFENGFAPEDFDGDGYLINVAAIADGSAVSPRARKHFPDWFKLEAF